MDNIEFKNEVEFCLSEYGITDLSAAGVELPLDLDRLQSKEDGGYESLCFICFWIYMIRQKIHMNLNARMVLGPQNKWTKLYSIISSGKDYNDKIKEIFEQAS
jgi:hypothetical protein